MQWGAGNIFFFFLFLFKTKATLHCLSVVLFTLFWFFRSCQSPPPPPCTGSLGSVRSGAWTLGRPRAVDTWGLGAAWIYACDSDNKLKRRGTDPKRGRQASRRGGGPGPRGSSARGRGAGFEDTGQLVGAGHLPGPRRHRRLARGGAPRRPRALPGSRARARPALGLPRAAASRAFAAAELGARRGPGPLLPAGPRRVRRVRRRRGPGRPGLRGGPAGLGPPLAAGRLLEPRPRGPLRAGRALPLLPQALLLLAAGRKLLWFPNVVLPFDIPSRVWAYLVGRVGGWGWM